MTNIFLICQMNYKFFLIPLVSIIFISIMMNSSLLQENIDEVPDKINKSNYDVFSIDLPKFVDFSGEKISLNENDLKERLDREILVNVYWQSNMFLMIKRSNKYFPIIEKILKEEGVPNDFKYLAVIESGLQNVRSPKGAKGIWQIMYNTGRELGLEVNSNVDERYNLELSTRAACKYLKKAKEKLGSWTLAAASYNRGISGIRRKLADQQVDNYYDLLLGTETKRYMFRVLAMKMILTEPSNYGYNYNEKDLYKFEKVKNFKVDTAITNLARFSKQMGINYKILKIHNPWLIQNHLNNKSRKLYNIKIPDLN
tara:strand:+ start:4973 stop:5911 length:939 start_codon:yes stop_codon:yes gene_type:complete